MSNELLVLDKGDGEVYSATIDLMKKYTHHPQKSAEVTSSNRGIVQGLLRTFGVGGTGKLKSEQLRPFYFQLWTLGQTGVLK